MERVDNATNLERIRNSIGIEVKVLDDVSAVLESLNQITGETMHQRAEGIHLTIITPKEKEAIRMLTDNEIHEITSIQEEIARGEGIEINGIGFIDGSKSVGLSKKDTLKKTSFIAVTIPKVQELRKSMGLPQKDLHITLGIAHEDIHDVPKVAQSQFAQITPKELHFGHAYALVSLKPFQTIPL